MNHARSQSVGSRAKGLVAPPRRLTGTKDPKRRFPIAVLSDVFKNFGHQCGNPWCDSQFFPLNVHHMYAHCLGGRSVIENALLLCTTCHRLVHSGAIPICVQICWKTGQSIDGLSDQLLLDDELISAIRTVPVSVTGTPQQRLVLLNSHLIQACHSRQHRALRLHAFAEIMLAKAAVLNDAYSERYPSVDPNSNAMKVRYSGILPFGLSAFQHAKAAHDTAAMIRALHYRSVAYDTMKKSRNAINTLAEAWKLCMQSMNERIAFHPLSKPGRILRSMALVRARMNGNDPKAIQEFNSGMSLIDPDNASDYDEAQIREIQFCLLTSRPQEAEKKLADAWGRIAELDINSRLLTYRMAAELEIFYGHSQHLSALINSGIQQAMAHRAFKQEYHFRTMAFQLGLGKQTQ